jgi:hypothetical protein
MGNGVPVCGESVGGDRDTYPVADLDAPPTPPALPGPSAIAASADPGTRDADPSAPGRHAGNRRVCAWHSMGRFHVALLGLLDPVVQRVA